MAWINAGQITLGLILGTLWTLGCWAMLPTTVKANQLLQEHPDLWISKKMRASGHGEKSQGRKRRR